MGYLHTQVSYSAHVVTRQCALLYPGGNLRNQRENTVRKSVGKIVARYNQGHISQHLCKDILT